MVTKASIGAVDLGETSRVGWQEEVVDLREDQQLGSFRGHLTIVISQPPRTWLSPG